MNLTPIKNNLIFTFVDRVNAKGEFDKGATESGILLQSSFDDSAKSPRWVNILAVGPDVTTIKPGEQALLPNLRWTPNFKVNEKMMWRSDETQAVAVRTTETSDVRPLNSVVLFKRIEKQVVRKTGSLFVIGGQQTDTPTGKVVSIGPDAVPDLANAVIFFDDTNFTDTFVHAGAELSFIKDDVILAYEE